MTNQTNHVKHPKVELKQNYDQISNQRQDCYDQEAVQQMLR